MTKKQRRNLLSVGLTLTVAVILILIGREDLVNEFWKNETSVSEVAGEKRKLKSGARVAATESATELTTKSATAATKTKVTESGELEIATVKRIIDGDTIELDDDRKVRYIGIDTPETKDPRKPVSCFGAEANEANRRLVEGKNVGLEKDISETDRYGRLLRYVYLWEGEEGAEQNTDLKMVQEIFVD